MKIRKSDGEQVPFQREKLLHSLRKSGAADQTAKQICEEIESTLIEGTSTRAIYKKAFALLRKNSRPSAARYKLRNAIMELGDTGYPFEKFISRLLEADGFSAKVGVVLQGKCVTHEVDVVAEKDHLHLLCECKFHNRRERHCDVKIPLYIHSRFMDIQEQWKSKNHNTRRLHQGLIFTNTRFTADAIQYGECVGLQLIGWDYPKGNSIKERVDRTGVHPVTSLTSLTVKEKKWLIEYNIVTCKEVSLNVPILSKINVDGKRIETVLHEARSVCAPKIFGK